MTFERLKRVDPDDDSATEKVIEQNKRRLVSERPKLRYAIPSVSIGIALVVVGFDVKQTSSALVDVTFTDAGVAVILFLPLYWIQNRAV